MILLFPQTNIGTSIKELIKCKSWSFKIESLKYRTTSDNILYNKARSVWSSALTQRNLSGHNSVFLFMIHLFHLQLKLQFMKPSVEGSRTPTKSTNIQQRGYYVLSSYIVSHLVSNSAVVITISFFISDFLQEKNLFHYAEAIISLRLPHTFLSHTHWFLSASWTMGASVLVPDWLIDSDISTAWSFPLLLNMNVCKCLLGNMGFSQCVSVCVCERMHSDIRWN